MPDGYARVSCGFAIVADGQERLAAYKCLVEIRVVEELPKAATGKIKRNTLRNEIRSS